MYADFAFCVRPATPSPAGLSVIFLAALNLKNES
jgi:hypothetical protein